MKHRLIIEIEGKIHEETKERDSLRDQHLASGDFRIIRFTNEDVEKNLPLVLEKIMTVCQSYSLT